MVDPDRPAPHLGDQRDGGRRSAHRTAAGQVDTRARQLPLAAAEPILIAAPMTRQPVDWAFSRASGPKAFGVLINRPWSEACDGHPRNRHTDHHPRPDSTPYEIACQVVLKAYWHGYIRQRRAGDWRTLSRWPTRAGRAHPAWDPCSEQNVCGSDSSRTIDPPRIRPGAGRGGDPSVRASEGEHRGNAVPEAGGTRPLPLDADRDQRTPLLQASSAVCERSMADTTSITTMSWRA